MRKLLAIILTLVMLVTSVSCLTLMTFAETSSVTAYTWSEFQTANTNNAIGNMSNGTGDNLFGGEAEWVSCVWPTAEPNKKDASSQTAEWLYNGAAYNSGNHVYTCSNWLRPGYDITKSYITFPIKGNFMGVDKLVFAAAETSKMYDFEVYVGNDKATLYDSANKVATYNASNSQLDKYVYLVELPQRTPAKYVGLKVTDARGLEHFNQAGYDEQYYLKLAGVAAFGGSACTVSDNLYNSATDTVTGTPAEDALNKGMKPVYSYKTAYGGVENGFIGDNTLALADGDYKPSCKLHEADGLNNSGDTSKLAYDLTEKKNVRSVTISSGANDTRHGIAVKWQVFIGNDLATLYDAGNLYGTVNVDYDTANLPKGNVTTITFPEDIQGQYVGIWFLKGVTKGAAGTDWVNALCLSEVAIHGSDIASEPPVTEPTVFPYTEAQFTAANAGNIKVDLSKNLLGGEPEWTDCFGNVTKTSSNNATAWMYNGGYGTENGIAGFWNWYSAYNGNVADRTMTFSLADKYSKVNKLFLASPVGQKILDFELYISDTKEDLYSAENKIITYTASAEDEDKYIYVIALPEGIVANYVGLKVPTIRSLTINTQYNSGSLHIAEIGAFGESNLTVEDNVNDTGYEWPLGTSLNFDMLPYLRGATTQSATDSISKDIAYLTDGVYTMGGYYRLYNAVNMTVAFDLKADAEIDQVMLLSGGQFPYASGWEIYVGNSLPELFAADNCYGKVTVAAQADHKTKVWTVADLDVKPVGRYVGVKILSTGNTGNTDGSVQLEELAFFGNSVGFKESAGAITTVPGANILNNTQGFALKHHNDYNNLTWSAIGAINSVNGSNSLSYAKLVDGDLGTEVTQWNFYHDRVTRATGYANHALRVGEGKYFFDLGEGNTATVGSAMVYGPNKYISYKAYVSNDPAVATSPELLFAEANLFAVHDNLDTAAALVHAPAMTGRFFGIMVCRVVVPATGESNSTFGATEIGFYAPVATGTDTTTALSGNIIDKDTDLYVSRDGKTVFANMTSVSGTWKDDMGEAATGFKTKLTNGHFADGYGGNTAYKGSILWNANKVRMVYVLDSEVSINKMIIGGGCPVDANATENIYAIKNYSIYVSNSSDNIFDPANIVAYHHNATQAQAQLFDFSTMNVKGKYIGILFHEAYDSSLRLTEIGVYGNFASDDYTVNVAPTDEQIANLGQNLLDEMGLTCDKLTDKTVAALLTDNVVNTTENSKAVTIEDAAGVKFTYDMGKTLPINKLLVAAKYNGKNNTIPVLYKIYVSENEADLYNTPFIQNYTSGWQANNFGAGATQIFNLTNVVNARYVGFEIVSTAIGYDDLDLIELGAYGSTDLWATLGTNIDAVYIDGEDKGNSSVVDAIAFKNNSSILVKYNDGSTKVFLANGATVTEETALANAFTYKGAQIRTEAPLGIRFVNTISDAALAKATKIGTIAAKFSDLNGADLLRIYTKDYTISDSVAFDKAEGVNEWYDEADNSFSIALMNLRQFKYINNYVSRPYIIVEKDDILYTIYGDTKMVSPYDVADAASNDPNANLSAEAEDFIDTVLAESSIEEIVKDYADALGISQTQLDASAKSGADVDYSRLAKVIKKAMSGQDIVIGTLGGSITEGAYSSAQLAGVPQSVTCYSNRFREWLANTFGVNVTLYNAGISATNSDLGITRFEENVLKYNPDLVIIEYAVNQGNTGTRTTEASVDYSYEACVRKALNQDAAVMMLFTVYAGVVDEEGNTLGTNDQVMEMKIGNHYKLPMVSFKDAAFDDATKTWREELGGDYLSVLSSDKIHPNSYGHQMISVLLGNEMAKAIAAYIADPTLADATPYAPADALYAKTKLLDNLKLYTYDNLPEEWIVSMGGWYVEGSQYKPILPYAWRMDSTDTAEMVLNIPNATHISVVYSRPVVSGEANYVILKFKANTIEKTAYANYSDHFAVTSELVNNATAADYQFTMGANFRTDAVKEVRVIGIAVSQAQ